MRMHAVKPLSTARCRRERVRASSCGMYSWKKRTALPDPSLLAAAPASLAAPTSSIGCEPAVLRA
jgi:hypothetical protein